jgi:hypothetical protein
VTNLVEAPLFFATHSRRHLCLNSRGFIMRDTDIDLSLNAADAARFEAISIPTMNRRIRKGQHPRPDYTVGPYRFWK